jgi:hypothetical protein
MAPLIEQGEHADRNKILVIASLLFLLDAGFADLSGTDFKFIHSEYLSLVLFVVGTYYCISLGLSCWRGWKRRANRLSLARLSSELLDEAYMIERNRLYVLLEQHHRRSNEAMEQNKVFWDGYWAFSDSLKTAINHAMAKHRVDSKADTTSPYQVVPSDKLRSELLEIVTSAISNADLREESWRQSIRDLLLRAVDDVTGMARLGRSVSADDIVYAPMDLVQKKYASTKSERDATVSAELNAMNALRERFERITPISAKAVEALTSMHQSYRFGLWWEFVLPVVYFLAVAIASQDRIVSASVGAWSQL